MFRQVFKKSAAESPKLARGFFQSQVNNGKGRPMRSSIPQILALAALGTGAALYFFDARSSIHEYVLCPIIRTVTDGEQGHQVGILCMKYGLSPRLFNDKDSDKLKVDVFGKTLTNPIGVAAGLDKDAEAMDALFSCGFSYVEVGSVTPEPQPGNPKPRFFRLPKDDAVINRYGFNSSGHFAVLARLRARLERYWDLAVGLASNSLYENKMLAINLGKNKNGEEVGDYVKGVQRMGEFADVLVINVSSPNTPGLRDLQGEEKLTELLKSVVSERNQLPGLKVDKNRKPPVLVKVAPDLSEAEIKSIASSAKAGGVDGIIISNTTIQRPQGLLASEDVVSEAGGLSGKPLKPLSLQALRTLRKYTKDSNLVLVGCGGIDSGKDALEFGKAGATFVELYTAFAYKGPGLAYKIKSELTDLLEKEGKSWMEIVGEDDK